MRTQSFGDPLGAATARVHFDAPRTVNVPLFRSLIDTLAEDRRWVVLDLGAARPQTIELFNRFRCRLDIADLADTAAASRDDEEDRVRFGDPAESLRSIPYTESTDIVFCWDFLNYLEPEQMTALSAGIAERCRPGALMHALIAYSDCLMPQWPGQFAPIDEGRLLNLSTTEPDRVAPRYSPEDLSSCMPGYAIERARLLTNGMQEYLFRLRHFVEIAG